MPGISNTDAMFARGLAATICVERPDLIVLNVGFALASVEYIIGGNMDEWDSTIPGFDCKSGRCLGVNGKSQVYFAFGAINIGISGRIDNDVPRPRFEGPSDRCEVF